MTGPIPTLNNYILECDSCQTSIFICWLRDEVPGYDTARGMSCPACRSKAVVLVDCDDQQPRHRAAKHLYTQRAAAQRRPSHDESSSAT